MNAADHIEKAEEFLKKAELTGADPAWHNALSNFAQAHVALATFKATFGTPAWADESQDGYNFGEPPF